MDRPGETLGRAFQCGRALLGGGVATVPTGPTLTCVPFRFLVRTAFLSLENHQLNLESTDTHNPGGDGNSVTTHSLSKKKTLCSLNPAEARLEENSNTGSRKRDVFGSNRSLRQPV